MVTGSRYAELSRTFDQAAKRAFSATTPEDLVALNPELSEAELFMVHGAYLQASRQACANAQAEFRVLAEAADLESKLDILETMEAEQGLDDFGGLAQEACHQHIIVPDDVARHCRLVSKRSEHRQLAEQLEKAEMHLASKKAETEELVIRAEEVTERYRQGSSQDSLSWRATADAH